MQLQQPDSESEVHLQLLVLWPLSRLVQLVLVEAGPVAALDQVETVVAAAPVVDRLGKERRTAAGATAAAGREGAGADLQGGCGGRTGRGQTELEQGIMEGRY